MTPLQNYLISLDACEDAVAWAADYETLADAWDACERGDWLLWLAEQTLPREQIAFATCQVARAALRYVPTGEERPLRCIEVTEAWCRDEATLDEVWAARADSHAYYITAVSASAASGAAAAAERPAAYAAAERAAACGAAERAAGAAAAAEGDYHAAYAASLASSAVIVRKHLQCPEQKMMSEIDIKAVEARLLCLGAMCLAHRVAREHGVPLWDVLGRGHAPSVVRARHQLWALTCGTYGLSEAETGRLFGVDHSTIHSALRVRETRLRSSSHQPQQTSGENDFC